MSEAERSSVRSSDPVRRALWGVAVCVSVLTILLVVIAAAIKDRGYDGPLSFDRQFGDLSRLDDQSVTLDGAKFCFGAGGELTALVFVDEDGARHGWSITFAEASPEDFGWVRTAQEYREGMPDGFHFFWDSPWGGGDLPYSFGEWRRGDAHDGVFVIGDNGDFIDSRNHVGPGDLAPRLAEFREGERVENENDVELTFRQFLSRRQTAAKRFEELKALVKRSLSLYVADGR